MVHHHLRHQQLDPLEIPAGYLLFDAMTSAAAVQIGLEEGNAANLCHLDPRIEQVEVPKMRRVH
jgi:hypothetical protein